MGLRKSGCDEEDDCGQGIWLDGNEFGEDVDLDTEYNLTMVAAINNS